MLQIIVFQLSAMIWMTSNLAKDNGSRVVGFILAAIFVALGLAQGAAFTPYPTP